MESQAPSSLVKLLDGQIRRALRAHDLSKLNKSERENLDKLSQFLTDARIYCQDYELSETRDDQLVSAKQAKKWLTKIKGSILLASQTDLFSAIEVAHLTAQADQAIANLK